MELQTRKFIKSKIFKIIVFIVGLFLLYESYALFVDAYNFGQLEKAKSILKSIPKDGKEFHNLKEFNEMYSSDIKPIKNCYLVSNYNGKEPYMFGFKLESLIYIYIYGTKYYAYPKYDIPYRQMCVGGIGCYDGNKEGFEDTISHPCKPKDPSQSPVPMPPSVELPGVTIKRK